MVREVKVNGKWGNFARRTEHTCNFTPNPREPDICRLKEEIRRRCSAQPDVSAIVIVDAVLLDMFKGEVVDGLPNKQNLVKQASRLHQKQKDKQCITDMLIQLDHDYAEDSLEPKSSLDKDAKTVCCQVEMLPGCNDACRIPLPIKPCQGNSNQTLFTTGEIISDSSCVELRSLLHQDEVMQATNQIIPVPNIIQGNNAFLL